MRMVLRFLRAAKQAWRHCRCSSDGTKEIVRDGNAANTSEGISPASTSESSSSSTPAKFFALVQFGDHLDLDTTSQRQLRNAECGASVLTDVAKNLADQFGAAVRDEMVLGEVRCGIDEADQLDDAADPAEVTIAGSVQGSDQIDGDRARRLFALLGAHVTTELTDPGFSVFLRDMA